MRFGEIEIHVLVDGRGNLPREAVFSDVAVDELDALLGDYPDDFPYNCLLVRSGAQTVLVDAGLGASSHPFGGRGGELWNELAAVGQRVEDIDVVVISHGHPDHIGGLVRDGAPAFPRARYVVSSEEWRSWTPQAEPRTTIDLGAAAARPLLRPLETHGVVEHVDGEAEVAPGVRVLPAPGHTPGQLAVEVEGALLFAVDAFLHRVQIDRPDVGHGVDVDVDVATSTLYRLLERARRRKLVLTASHLEAPLRVD